MKSLYLRICMTTVAAMIFSSVLAFILSNVYYQHNLKPVNDQKITRMAENIKHFYEKYPKAEMEDYLNNIGELGYQIYVVGQDSQGKYYGGEFRQKDISPQVVQDVLQGNTYHGIANFASTAFITGFFDNTLVNTIGMPIHADGSTYAMFVRPNIGVQLGELHFFLAVLVILIIVISILFVIISTRYIVNPITKLTEATQLITQGTYHLKLNVKRRDEIGRLADHFSRMAKNIEQLEEMRQEFVSNVSHEIQSPLASIQGFSQTLQTQNIPEEQRMHYLSVIEGEARRMSQMSKQLLMMASLDKEENVLEKSTFDVADQLKQVLSMTEWSWREKDLVIELSLPQVYIHADQKLLHQVWTNLITNSIKFTPIGGSISIKLRQDEHECYVDIKDTGAGIAAEDLPRIFNRFYKADKARSRKEGETGSGLGLAITHKIITMHRGHIDVMSQPNEGTVFQVRLPMD